MASPSLSGADVLRLFDAVGPREVARLIREDPAAARRWFETTFLILALLKDTVIEPEERHAPTASDPDEQSADESLAYLASLPRSRVNLLLDVAIIEYALRQVRAVSISGIHDHLVSLHLLASASRPALIARLNRLKSKEFLEWSAETRGLDVRVTEVGRKYAADVRNRLLNEDELSFLDGS